MNENPTTILWIGSFHAASTDKVAMQVSNRVSSVALYSKTRDATISGTSFLSDGSPFTC